MSSAPASRAAMSGASTPSASQRSSSGIKQADIFNAAMHTQEVEERKRDSAAIGAAIDTESALHVQSVSYVLPCIRGY